MRFLRITLPMVAALVLGAGATGALAAADRGAGSTRPSPGTVGAGPSPVGSLAVAQSMASRGGAAPATGPQALPALPGFSTAAAAEPSAEEPPVIIDPLLGTLETGTRVGAPIVCSTLASLAGTATSSLPPEVVEQFTDASVAIAVACLDGATQFADAVGTARPQFQQLAAMNDALRPGMLAFAAALRDVAENQGASVSPFGPAIVTLAEDIEFFAG